MKKGFISSTRPDSINLRDYFTSGRAYLATIDSRGAAFMVENGGRYYAPLFRSEDDARKAIRRVMPKKNRGHAVYPFKLDRLPGLALMTWLIRRVRLAIIDGGKVCPFAIDLPLSPPAPPHWPERGYIFAYKEIPLAFNIEGETLCLFTSTPDLSCFLPFDFPALRGDAMRHVQTVEVKTDDLRRLAVAFEIGRFWCVDDHITWDTGVPWGDSLPTESRKGSG